MIISIDAEEEQFKALQENKRVIEIITMGKENKKIQFNVYKLNFSKMKKNPIGVNELR